MALADASASFEDAASLEASDAMPVPLAATRHPIVLVHGLGASSSASGLSRVYDALLAAGHRVYRADMPPFAASETRATYLAADIDRILAETGAVKVNLIAHSQGGLDSRHAISALGYGDRVATLSTISTPHRGSLLADAALGLGGLSSTVAIDALAGLYGARISDLDADTEVRAALISVSEANAPIFEAAHPDDPRVVYQSWAGLSSAFGLAVRDDEQTCGVLLFDARIRDSLDPLLLLGAGIVSHGLQRRAHDGLVTVDSAKHGTFYGCLPADHLDEVGERNDTPPNAGTGFDFLAFYRALAAELAARGF